MATLLAINNYYYYRGGAETVFLEHNKMFEANGWRVVPFCMQHPLNLTSPWQNHFIEEIEFGADYSFVEKLVRVPKVIYSREARRKLSGLMDVVRPDVCHAHNIYNHISPAILSLLHDHGVPTVLTLHDLKIACPAYNMLAPDGVCERCKGGRIYNVLVHRCVKQSAVLSAVVMLEAMLHKMLRSYENNVSKFIVPSRFYIDKLVDWGMPENRFAHVPNFVDSNVFKPQYQSGEAFLYFGRVSREKGLITLVRAAAAAKAKLFIAGTGPQLDELRALANQLAADVSFLGFLTGEKLHDAIRSSRAVVLPSEWYENAPMTVLESYALGKPVVGARIGGIPELIRDGESGIGFESGNVESLTSALLRIRDLGDAEISNMGRGGRQWVERDFTAERYRQRILEIYRDLAVTVPVAGAQALRTRR